jgi:hypothetical protein
MMETILHILSKDRTRGRQRSRRGNSLERDLSRFRRPTSAAFAVGHLDRSYGRERQYIQQQRRPRRSSYGRRGLRPQGQKLYDLKGSSIYKLNGDLVGHLSDARSEEKRLDKTTDKLFPST